MVVCPDEMDTTYLDNLDEYINDEGRIVTYKWLSLTLGVHSNVAKQMLHHFVTQQRNGGGGGGLTLTYLLSGVVEEPAGDGEGTRCKKVVKVVRESEMEAARTAMSVVSSVHVYSVQKSTLPDIGVLYGADYDVMKQKLSDASRYSGIKCCEAQVTSSTGRLQQVVKEEAPPLQKNAPKSTNREDKKPVTEKDTTSTTTTTTTATSTSKPTNQIANMFAQQSKKQEAAQKTAVKEVKAPAKTKAGGISAFFTKGPTQRKADTSSKTTSPGSDAKLDSSPGPDKPKDSMLTEEAQESPKSVEVKEEVEKEVKKEKEEERKDDSGAGKTKTGKKKPTATQKRKSKGKKEEPKTKRTRIMQLSDSDSDDDDDDKKEEEEERLLRLPSPPPPVRVESDSEEEREGEGKSVHQSTSPEEEAKPGMRRKLVDETYEDENGYFVTKKVYKLVELTEEEQRQEEEEKKELEEKRKKEQEEKRRKEEEKKEKEKNSPPVKRDSPSSASSPQKKKRGGKKDDGKKQTNITSFFSRK